MLVVAALGGNALLRRGEEPTVEVQRRNVEEAAAALAALARAGHSLVVTHGNGPQIGLLAVQHRPGEQPYPLDVLGAETEGMIGYLIEQALGNALDHDRPVATLLTQVVVDPADPAFARPTKPIGPGYDHPSLETRAAVMGWSIAQDGGWWRRVVPSPAPREIPDAGVIRMLLDHGAVVVCGGGGGIPVLRKSDGSLVGVEAVVDKDATSAGLAAQLGADALLLLTDEDGVQRGFGTPGAHRIDRLDRCAAEALGLPEGSMAPKVAAALAFADRGGHAAIGRMGDALALLGGERGTVALP
jgi:carbamate kinase